MVLLTIKTGSTHMAGQSRKQINNAIRAHIPMIENPRYTRLGNILMDPSIGSKLFANTKKTMNGARKKEGDLVRKARPAAIPEKTTQPSERRPLR
jgi:hypothetical protein